MNTNDVNQTPVLTADNIDAIARFIIEWTPTDGAHHKIWVLDQVLRMLTGDQYYDYIAGIEWDEGISP